MPSLQEVEEGFRRHDFCGSLFLWLPERRPKLRTTRWSDRSIAEPLAPQAWPARTVRSPNNTLSHSHPGVSALPSPARAAIARASTRCAEATSPDTPLAAGAPHGRLLPQPLAGAS
jgi:hypothetical protein